MNLRPRSLALAAAVLFSLSTSPQALAHGQSWTGTFLPEGSGGRTGSGSLLVEYDEHSNVLTITASFEGLSSDTRVAHIHCCSGPFPASAGVALAGTSNAFGANLLNFPSGVRAADYSQNFDMGLASVYSNAFRNNSGGTANGARDALLAAFDNGFAYMNIHTDAFPGGEIRAQIAPIPEPSTWLMMALGLAGVAAGARRKSAA